MKKIIVLIIVIGFIVSATPMVTSNETDRNPKRDLFSEIEKLLAFEGTTAREILDSMPFVDNPNEIALDSEENLRLELSQEIQNIETSYEIMKNSIPITPSGDGETKYWAVMIGTDCTECTGNRFLAPFYNNVDCMYNTLLVSEHWKKDHILVLKNEDATLINIIVALLWLDLMEDNNDVSLVYYAAHGGQMNYDLIPHDEDDGKDEYLTTYWTGINPFAIITDDLLTFLLNRLDSQGAALIIDACHGGGMDDSDNQGRITMTICKEDELGIPSGWKLLGAFISEGYQGYADNNSDGMVSAEEAYNYAAPLYYDAVGGDCNSTIDDRYPGELILTEVELPPNKPQLSTNCDLIGQAGDVFVFNASSVDPENDKIRYGWNWRNDSIPDFSRWDGSVQEWSDYYDSGEICKMNHSWSEPGVYTVQAKAQDEHGAEKILDKNYGKLWTNTLYVLIHGEGEIVDRYQLVANAEFGIGKGTYKKSFIPNANNLAKIKLKLTVDYYYVYNHQEYLFEEYPLNVSIREASSGENLVSMSWSAYEEIPSDQLKWIEFDFPDITVTPGEKYHIIVSCDYRLHYPNEGVLYSWAAKMLDTNPNFCFITYSDDGILSDSQQISGIMTTTHELAKCRI